MTELQTTFIREPLDVYLKKERSGEFLTGELLNDFRKCPELYYRKIHRKIQFCDDKTVSLDRAAHIHIIQSADVPDHRGKNCQNKNGINPFCSSGSAKEKVRSFDYVFIRRLAMSVWTHTETMKMLLSGVAEAVVRRKYCDIPCQIRMDFFNPAYGIIELKVCKSIDQFSDEAWQQGYVHQMAFARTILFKALNKKYAVYFIAVEKTEPFRTGVWCISNETMRIAEQQNIAAVKRLKECRDNNTWPTGYEEIRTM